MVHINLSSRLKAIGVCAAFFVLNGCSSADIFNYSLIGQPPELEGQTTVSNLLRKLPPPAQPVTLAVYRFNDQTGQNRPSDNFSDFSRAVTQGGASFLAKALYDAGNGSWFNVLEREGLTDLAQERKIIRATREEYAGPNGQRLKDIGPLHYAGMLIHGGIVAYDSDTVTGGLGARYLGVGGTTEYRQDVVTIALRAVSVKTGQVLLAINTSKTIFLTSIDGDLFRFTSLDELLQIESGVTVNEPPQFAVKQAIELAVYSMVMEGAEKGLWGFANPALGNQLIADYVSRRDGNKGRVVDSDVEDLFKRQAQAAPKPAPARATVAPAPQQPPARPAVRAPAQFQAPLPPQLPAGSDRVPIEQLPDSAVRAPEKKSVPVNSPDEFKQKLKQALQDIEKSKNEDNVDNVTPRAPSDGVGGGIGTDGDEVIYCGPSGCFPARETR